MNADVEADRQFILYASHTFAAVREVRREQSDCWSWLKIEQDFLGLRWNMFNCEADKAKFIILN